MIKSDAAIRHPYIYGEILSRSLCQSPLSKLPGFGRFLSQGIVVGAFVSFLFPMIGLLINSKGYNYLLIYWLPFFLATGMGFGLFEGLFLWACSYIAGRRLNVLVRAAVGTIVFIILIVTFDYFYYSDQPANSSASLRDWLPFIGFYCAIGTVFGLVSGSKFSPLSELLRGTTPPRFLVLNGITGFFLRVLIIYALMETTLILIWTIRVERPQHELVFVAIAFSHCLAGTAVLFTRVPFWLLLLLALLINFPVAALITDVLTKEQELERNFIIAYLTLWTAFLLCRVSVPRAVLLSVKKELRYYLID